MPTILSRTNLNREDYVSVELLKCSASPAYFISKYCYLDDTQGDGDGSGVVPFSLWNFQVGLIWTLDQEKLLLVLKARQLGISWAVCAYELWRTQFLNNQLILLLSIGEKEAIELLRRVKKMYERLPEWLKEHCPIAGRPNTEKIEFSNGSRVISLSSSDAKGSGYTASSVVLDEFAKNPVADSMFSSIMPTVEAGSGQLIIVSTAFGAAGKFYELWTKASRHESSFKNIFFPWWVRPGRDAAWYQRQLDTETDIERVKENYPSTPTEAFRTSGAVRFRASWIEAQSVNVKEPIAHTLTGSDLATLDTLEIYEIPRDGHEYAIGADTSEGVGDDPSDAVVIDLATWEEVAHLAGQWEPDYFAKQLIILSTAYNRAMVAVERNNHGHAVVATFKLLGFADVILDDDHRYGLQTNAKTKPKMIDCLAEALRDELVTIHSQATLDEMLIYRRDPGGSTSAPPGFHDDRVMSWAILLSAIRRPVPDYHIGPGVEIKLEQRPLFTTIAHHEAEWNRNHPGHIDKHSNKNTTELAKTFLEMGRVKERRSFYGR